MAIDGPYDRVMETTTTTGTGTLALDGAVAGHQTFEVVPHQSAIYACVFAVNSGGNPTGDWEVFQGTYHSGNRTLSRDNVLASSNVILGEAQQINFSAGTKRVAQVLHADFFKPLAAQWGGTDTTLNEIQTGSLLYGQSSIGWELVHPSAGVGAALTISGSMVNPTPAWSLVPVPMARPGVWKDYR